MRNALGSEEAAVVGVIDPDAYPAATYTSGWVSMATFGKVMAVLQIGTMQSGATLDAKLEQRAGNGEAKDLSPAKAITQLTEADADSNKQVVIDVSDDDLDVANDYDQVRLSVTIATADVDFGAVLMGMDPRQGPAVDYDLASVDEVVN